MKQTNITLSIALAAVFSSSVVFAEAEVTGKIVHETAKFTSDGALIGASTTDAYTTSAYTQNGKDVFKTATHAKIFIDGDAEELLEGATYHVELNAFNNGKGVDKYDGNESYTQRDALREAYVDAETNGYSIRAGKQQVVWGTADGMKLLDAINPTDYSEMAQNQMEDSRIPVWMVNVETDLPTGGNMQFILSEAKSSKIAGLGQASASGTSHTNGNTGHAFIMKGVDSITGKSNGFLNVAPVMGKAARVFDQVAVDKFPYSSLTPVTGSTVQDFATGVDTGFQAVCTGGLLANENSKCLANLINNAAIDRAAFSDVAGANDGKAHNVLDTGSSTDVGTQSANWDVSNPNSAFEYVYLTKFSTFDAFVDMTSEYRVEEPSDAANIALRYKNSTANGVNYSVNYLNHYDTNPYVELSWEKQDGTKLQEKIITATNTLVLVADASAASTTSLVGAQVTGGTAGAATADRANLVLTEKLNKISSLGGSFDMAVETSELGPVVIRGEALYQKGVKVPVVTRSSSDNIDIEHGFLANGFAMKDADFFKYVIGADITALTNMMISAQFIQLMNLDYVSKGSSTADADWQYTADSAVMSMSNGFKKAEENKEFYSLFLSKPFGASGEHRWNNIFMFEENGGKWNRLDAEFSIDDDTQATVEWNKYFGDENTQFGQLSKSSNIQVGFKYSF